MSDPNLSTTVQFGTPTSRRTLNF